MTNGPKPHPLFLFFLLGVLIPVALCFILRPFPDLVPSVPALYTSFGFSILAFVTTLYLVPTFGPRFIQANLKGRNLLKIYSTLVYGLVCASVYLLVPYPFHSLRFSNVFADPFYSQQKFVQVSPSMSSSSPIVSLMMVSDPPWGLPRRPRYPTGVVFPKPLEQVLCVLPPVLSFFRCTPGVARDKYI